MSKYREFMQRNVPEEPFFFIFGYLVAMGIGIWVGVSL